MSTIAHLGPGVGRQGGPAGYLLQLRNAFDAHGTGRHRVILPHAARASNIARASSGQLLTLARRVRRTYLGMPAYARPSVKEARTPGGPIATLLRNSWVSVQDDAAASLHQGIEAQADVLFAHDAPTAESALEHRARGQQVWLMMHTPMPLPLYLAWCWGVPDRPHDEVATYPDVIEWTRRERRILDQVDRIVIPCAEAVDDLIRACADFAPPLGRVDYLMTGGEGPPRRRSATGASLRESFGLPANEPIALFLGNMQPYRGLDAVLAAVRLLPSPRELPGVVAIAGCPPEQLPLHARLRALGSVADVADLLEAVDFVINTNRFSLFDLSLIEATQAAKPLLLHAVGGNRAFAALGAGCRLLDTIAPATIASGLTEFFMNAAVRPSLADRSRDCWLRSLTLRHLRDRHITMYDQFAGAAARPA